jgi:hypothetical protein
MRRAVVGAILVLVAGCKSSGPSNAVDLTIIADGSVTPATLGQVRSLVIAVSGVHNNTKSYPLGGLPKQETVQLLPTVSSGMLNIDVSATDGAMKVLAEGHTSVTLNGKIVPAMVTLLPPAPPTVNVTPSMATVTRGHTQQFHASVPVSWSVGGSNGTIDANGLYTAPMTPGGPFTVVATSTADPSASAQATVRVVDYRLELLAGGLGGPGEADGSGASARLNVPTAVASDGNGNLYVSEFSSGTGNGCTLRKVDLTGTIPVVSRLGGVPGQCLTVDGKLGVDARFSFIRALTADVAAGVLWVVEIGAIRKVTLATGMVTTLQVGTPPGPLNFSGYTGLAIDSANNTLYISSQGQQTIHKVVLTGAGTDTLFAGIARSPGADDAPSGPATMARFHSPQHLAFDGTNLWVADRDNSTLRKIVVGLNNGQVTTVAGMAGVTGSSDGVGSAARLTSPVGLSLGNTPNTLYVTDQAVGVVRTFATGSSMLTTLAGTAHANVGVTNGIFPAADNGRGLSATFGEPRGITYDTATGTLFVVEIDNSILRQIGLNASNAVTTVAGTQALLGNKDGAGPSARFWSLGNVVSDGSVAYLADNGNATIRSYDLATGLVSTVAGQAGMLGGDDGAATTQARFNRPEGLFLDGTNLYISDGGGSTIRKLDLTTKTVSTLAGQYLVPGFADGIATAATFTYPVYITGDGADHLFVSDLSAPILRRLTLSTGEVKTIAGNMTAGFMDGTGTGASFSAPYGIAVDGGVLYVCDAAVGNGAGVRAVDLTSFVVKTVAGGTSTDTVADGMGSAAKLVMCSGLASDGHGHIYFGDNAVLRELDVKNGYKVSSIVGKPFVAIDQPGPLATATLNVISAIAVLPSGDLLFDDFHESNLLEVRLP